MWAICARWPHLDPADVATWPWHRHEFYVEGLLAEQAANDPGDGGSDPLKPMSGDLADFDLAAIGATRLGG